MAHRLPAKSTDREARDQWREIVEGRSSLWVGIPNDRKEMIRGWSSYRCCISSLIFYQGFLVYFESEVLKRAQKNFSFLNGRWELTPCQITEISTRIVLETTSSQLRKNSSDLYLQRSSSFLPLQIVRSVWYIHQKPLFSDLTASFPLGEYPSSYCDEPYSHYCCRISQFLSS